ncbi:RICIN domain-containing protein [Nonomuraea sp. NPDC050643]|uniref:RICIN domain-containing protein n=1 Tax=Nonomuraea sp. NPDC050643 TaxID=3155660 RepID=UPI0033DE4C69
MFRSRSPRRIAVLATALCVAGIGAALASPAQAETFKELEYRGNASKLVMTAAANLNGSFVVLRPDSNSRFGQWAQTATSSSGGGQAAFIYTLRASLESGSPLCLTAKNTVEVIVATCNNTDSQKWFHPTAVAGPGGTLPTKNVATLRHLGQSQSAQAPLSLFGPIGGHFWAKRTA